jgi:hypothetical protein
MKTLKEAREKNLFKALYNTKRLDFLNPKMIERVTQNKEFLVLLSASKINSTVAYTRAIWTSGAYSNYVEYQCIDAGYSNAGVRGVCRIPISDFYNNTLLVLK